MIKLICYNIEYCQGMEGLWWQYLEFWRIFRAPCGLDDRIIDALKQLEPDILALVEVDTGSMRAKKNEVEHFSKALHLTNHAERIKYDNRSYRSMFHHMPILDHQANAIMTKFPIKHVRYHMLHAGTKRMVIEARIGVPEDITLLLAHLALGKKDRKKQLQELIRVVNKIETPVILMGDFNTFNGAREILQLLQETHLHDYAKLDKISQGLTHPTWHPKRRLDYVLTSPQIHVHQYQVLNFHFSDHMPLFVTFSLRSADTKSTNR